MNIKELSEILDINDYPKRFYSLNGGKPNDSYCIDYSNGFWNVYYSERGEIHIIGHYEKEEDACLKLLERLMLLSIKKRHTCTCINNAYLWHPLVGKDDMYCLVLCDIFEPFEEGNKLLYTFDVLKLTEMKTIINITKEISDSPRYYKTQLTISNRFIREFLSLCLYLGKQNKNPKTIKRTECNYNNVVESEYELLMFVKDMLD
ncbi:MAG: hypothetical protein IKN14_05065 [Clostridiales bacterium]|nr:hypothetical protein [Clostridiales bacterium]